MSEPTLGQKSVGLSFNPSGDKNVHLIKQGIADIIDLVDQSTKLDDPVHRKLRDAAMHELESAQMWAVKVITWEKK